MRTGGPATLPQFFEEYAARSTGAHPEALTSFYAKTFIVAGPEGSQAFTNDAEFVAWLKQVGEFNREHGMRELCVLALDEAPLSPRHTLATVRWGARFERTSDRLIEFQIAYLMERSDAGWKVLA